MKIVKFSYYLFLGSEIGLIQVDPKWTSRKNKLVKTDRAIRFI